MIKTDITPEQLCEMNDDEFIKFCREYPFPSQWQNSKSNFHRDYRLSLICGNNYIKTGNVNSFKTTLLRYFF